MEELINLSINSNISVKDINISDLRDRIEAASKFHHIEILRILSKKPNVVLNENNNGTFINLTEQNEEIIKILYAYVNYIDAQQKHLDVIENEKNRIETEYFRGSKVPSGTPS
jgi:CTP-dependent riboflavin kinase